MRLNKINKLKNGNLLFFWCKNNRGVKYNSTLIIVSPGIVRADKSAKQENVISKTKTNHWLGDVNLSKRVCENLGIDKSDILID